MSGPTVKFGAPDWSLFKFPPDPAPPALPPPSDEHTFKAPFAIPPDLYNNLLQFSWPLTIALVYATTVHTINAYNRKHGNQPWRISKTSIFHAFVILHNVFLAVYSGVTCVAMIRALKRSLPRYDSENLMVGIVDGLCKMHGPRGLGDAVTYNTSTDSWGVENTLINLGFDGMPDSTDVGRIWNEGLAFWGWFFYLSKFYEVFDTFIILAKGKRSTTLQTFHHAGAMLCMWAGIRYMSPPIWMFALVNSGIHTMMYTYYTLSALHFRVPQAVKRSLTTLQIIQFLIGASFAAIHLFVSYTIPVSVPYFDSETVASATSAVSATASSMWNEGSVALATGTALAALKAVLFRAAGEEGLAENVLRARSSAQAPVHTPHIIQEAQHIFQKPTENVRYRTHYQEVSCIDTTGQSFAIWLNLIYLAPLTGLFVRFFVKSYLRRTSTSTKHPTRKRALSKSGKDAVHGVDREIDSLGKAAEDNEIKVAKKGKSRNKGSQQRTGEASISNDQRVKKVVEDFNRKVSQSLEDANLNGQATLDTAKNIAKDIMEKASPRKEKKNEAAASPSNSKQTASEIINTPTRPKVEGDAKEEKVLEETKIEPLKDESEAKTNGEVKKEEANNGIAKENGEAKGLSNTDPKDKGVDYANMVKKSKE